MVNDTPVAAYSKLTSKTELSTHEAELAALDYSRVHAEEVAQILRELGVLEKGPSCSTVTMTPCARWRERSS